MKYLSLSIVILLLFTSCGSSKRVTYLQQAGVSIDLSQSPLDSLPAPTIKNGDQLMITVNTTTPEASVMFNAPLVPDITQNYRLNSTTSTAALQTYMVDTNGEIAFPVIGRLRVAGMNKKQLERMIHDRIFPRYMKEDPVITIRYINFKVSVLGEVNRPGAITAPNERISILDALSQAGDLTIYGRRDNVLLIREDARGKRINFRINLTDKNLITSQYYFLQQNDVIYVEPNKQRARGSAFGVAETLSISVVGTLISLASLIATLTR